MACRVLNVSRSGYYDWLGRPTCPRAQENEYLFKLIERIHAESRDTYGSPRDCCTEGRRRLACSVRALYPPFSSDSPATIGVHRLDETYVKIAGR